MQLTDYIFYFFFYSFIGWFIESCYCSIRPKKWVNRGFLRGPLCPIYGTGALVFLILITPLRDITGNLYINELLVFSVGLVVADIVEYFTSFIMEKLFHARWWDYTGKKFNLHGRICLTHTFYWGTAACVFCYIVQPVISVYFTELINPASRKTLVYIFLTVFALDLTDTVINALGLRSIDDRITKLTEEIVAFSSSKLSTIESKFDNITEDGKKEHEAKFNSIKEQYENLNQKYKKSIIKTKNRLFNAYPLLQREASKRVKYLEEQLEELKNKINK